MKIVRFRTDNNIKMYGILRDNIISALDGDIFKLFYNTGVDFPVDKVKILSPVPHPNKIIGVGLNYKKHAKEWAEKTNQKFEDIIPDNPILFLKPPTSRIGQFGEIELPVDSSEVEYEGELALIIGKECRNVNNENALKYVLGYTCANDVTARDIQKKDIQWTRSKGFDTFCPLGPTITLQKGFEFPRGISLPISGKEKIIENPDNINILTYLNGRKVQDFSTKDMIFSVPYLISFISKVMTLYPGDVILTGTDVGVGRLNTGDKVEVEVKEIGKLVNTVVRKESF